VRHQGNTPSHGASAPPFCRVGVDPRSLHIWLGLGRQHSGLFVAIVEPFEEFAHPAVRIGEAKLFLDPADCFGGAADIGIEPGRELLLLLVSQPAIATDIVEVREGFLAATCKGFDPAFEGFGMDMQDRTDSLGILTTIQEENSVQALVSGTVVYVLKTPK
jgi:hypothetical protein